MCRIQKEPGPAPRSGQIEERGPIMFKLVNDRRWLWLGLGVLAGICVASLWPQDRAKAATTDRDSKFAMATIPVSLINDVEGLFVLDFLTGNLTGGVIDNKTGEFLTRYARNIAADFGVDPKAEPHYCIVAGRANLPAVAGRTPATGLLYIGELSSGKVIAYTFPYQVARQVQVAPLTPLTFLQFREPAALD